MMHMTVSTPEGGRNSVMVGQILGSPSITVGRLYS
jgi:hypothetical protein